MTLVYQTSVICFRPELTNPRGPSVPLGAFVAGDFQGCRVMTLLVSVGVPTGLEIPDILLPVFEKLHESLASQIDALCRRPEGSAALDKLTESLALSMRNSFFVSDVSEEQRREIVAPLQGDPVRLEVFPWMSYEAERAFQRALSDYEQGHAAPLTPRATKTHHWPSKLAA